MNKRTKALTTEEYTEIIQAMKEGFCGFRPNERIATALVLEGNLGLRISDVLRLRPCDIVNDGGRYRLEIIEKKTGKSRVFTVPLVIRSMNESIVRDTGKIYQAIKDDKKITYKFFHYDREKQKVYPSKKNIYIVSPFATLWLNGYYYLYAYVDGENKFRFFRFDRMENAKNVLEMYKYEEKV